MKDRLKNLSFSFTKWLLGGFKTGGAGLGLAIAKEIVTLHGGSITADSRDEKTVFCVSLPLRD